MLGGTILTWQDPFQAQALVDFSLQLLTPEKFTLVYHGPVTSFISGISFQSKTAMSFYGIPYNNLEI